MKFKEHLTKMMPTRAQAKNTDVFFDFDKMQSESVPFKLNGKVHHLKPVTVGEFYALANGLAHRRIVVNNKHTLLHGFHVLLRFQGCCAQPALPQPARDY